MHPSTVKYREKNKGIYQLFRTDVNEYLHAQRNRQYANDFMIFKIFFCLVFFALSYSLYIDPRLTYIQWLGICMLLGIASVLMGVNIAHDAIHGSLFRRKGLNKLASFTFDIIGLSSYTWKLKHNYLHHHYPNVIDVDLDIQAGPVLRFSPGDKLRWFHRYQHLYAPLVYILFSIHLVFVNDFLLVAKKSNLPGLRIKMKWYILPLIIFQKLLYIFLMIILPVMILPFSFLQVITGFLLMHFMLSILLALLLLPSHIFENTYYSHLSANNELTEDWTIHQLSTTLDFASQNNFVHFISGGFNTNVIHHLFPSVCHCHYKKLTALIRNRAAELNLPYYHTSLPGAIRSHFRTLKQLSQKQP